MRTPTTFRIAALLGALALSLLASAPALAAERSLSSEVTLQPMDKPGAYKATMELRDASTQEVLFAPTIAFMKGGPANASGTLSSGEEVHFTIQVDASGASASYTAEIRSAGKAIALQKATIALAR